MEENNDNRLTLFDFIKNLFHKIMSMGSNIIFILIVLFVISAVVYFSSRDLTNSVNRIWMNYDKIVHIETDYDKGTVTFTMASDVWWEQTGSKYTVKLKQIWNSDLMKIDNSQQAPVYIDGVVYFPENY